MAELVFNKVGEEYVAEFEAAGDFNLHIEGVIPRNVTLLQRTSGSGYDVVRNLPQYPPLSKVMDMDCQSLIYPKYIKVVCRTEPTLGVVTFSA